MTKKELNAAKKRLVEIRSRVDEINGRFEEIKTALGEGEKKRAMNDKENEEFRNLSEEKKTLLNERDILNLQIETARSGLVPEAKQENLRMAFAKLVYCVRNKKEIPEEMRCMISDTNDINIPLTRDLTDSAAINPVVPITVGDLMMPLNNGIVYNKLGLKIQTGLKGTFNFPSVTGVEATFEDENVEVSDQSVSISKLTGSPKRISISVPVSNTAIDESNVNLQALVIALFGSAMDNLLNKWMLSKSQLTKTVTAPKGPFVDAVTTPAVSVAKANAITWKNVIDLETSVQKKHLPITGSSAFVCSSSMLADLRTTDRGTATNIGRYIAEAVGKGEYEIDGYPVFVSEDVDDNVLEFGVFEYDLLGQFGTVRMVVDPYTDAKKNITRFVFNTRWDNVVLKSEAFAALVHLTA
jgi:hypothetical protein